MREEQILSRFYLDTELKKETKRAEPTLSERFCLRNASFAAVMVLGSFDCLFSDASLFLYETVTTVIIARTHIVNDVTKSVKAESAIFQGILTVVKTRNPCDYCYYRTKMTRRVVVFSSRCEVYGRSIMSTAGLTIAQEPPLFQLRHH